MVPSLAGYLCYQEFLRDQYSVLCCSCCIWMTFIVVFLTVRFRCQFADDIALYREIVLPSDQELLQEDLNQVYAWSCKWLLNLNPSKCDSICISYKHSPPLAQYQLGGQQLSTKSTIPYLGIYINSHLKWNDCVKCITAKSSRTLNHLRHAFYTCPSSVEATVYRCMVCPLLEYASPVWYLYSPGDIKKLEAVQRRAARWVCGSRWNATRQCWSRTSDSCLDQLKWLLSIAGRSTSYLSAAQYF